MDLDYIKMRPERKEEILGLNLWQFTEAEQLNKLLGIMADFSQETMQVFVDISKGWVLNSAEGVQLDFLGEEIRVDRGPYNDEEYKLLQLIISKFRTGNVTRDGIVEAFQIISGDVPVDIYVGNFKNIDVVFLAECRSSLVVGKEIPRLVPLVTNLRILAKVGTPFGFDGDDSALGFGSIAVDSPLAGSLVSLIER